MEKISIIIPTYNEEKYIVQTIESLLNDNYPKNLLEILVIDGDSTDNTKKLIQNLQQKYPFIKLINNPCRTTPHALNLGIKLANGDIIIRADAHAEYEQNYISRLVFWLKKLNADNVGGRFIHTPINKNPVSIAIAKIFGSKFGIGNALYRTSSLCTDKPIQTDTVPYGCWRKETFQKFGFFNEKLKRNQDIEFNKRIIKAGGKIFLIPSIKIFYHPKEKYFELAKYAFTNSFWNILTIFYAHPNSPLSLRHYIPLFFVTALLLPLILGLVFNHKFFIFTLIILLIYFFSAFVSALKLKSNETTVAHLITGYFILHFFYGLGEIFAIFSLPFILLSQLLGIAKRC